MRGMRGFEEAELARDSNDARELMTNSLLTIALSSFDFAALRSG
jgi:hypothetical protein